MATISMSINVVYETTDIVDADEAVSLVTLNMQQLLMTLGIKDGVQTYDKSSVPMFCPPPLRRVVEVVQVKPLIVVGP